jgi:hypothetical protein
MMALCYSSNRPASLSPCPERRITPALSHARSYGALYSPRLHSPCRPRCTPSADPVGRVQRSRRAAACCRRMRASIQAGRPDQKPCAAASRSAAHRRVRFALGAWGERGTGRHIAGPLQTDTPFCPSAPWRQFQGSKQSAHRNAMGRDGPTNVTMAPQT